MKLKDFVLLCICASLTLNLSGCATAPISTAIKPPEIPGIYHRVEKGQTLWRISRMYNVNLDELIRINHISENAQIEIGQQIFIPKYQEQKKNTGNNYGIEDFIWPVKGRVIVNFGQAADNIINKGIDIQAYGNQNVVASRSGKVAFYSPNFNGFGKTIIIDHGDGFSSVYAKSAQVLIKAGDYVQKGMTIAKIGQSRRDRNNCLHFEIRKKYIPQNPNFYLP